MQKQEEIHYPLLELAQFGASLLVILIHCGRLAESDWVHFLIKSMLCRQAVPLFFVTTGFFYRKKQKKNPNYTKNYFRRQGKDYLFWSLLYLPYGLIILTQQNLPFFLYPIALLVGLGYLGICYHLWYYPALFSGLWLAEKLQKKIGYPKSILLALGFFSLGAIETYSSYLKGSYLHQIYQAFVNIFITTRNGLFYAMIFLLLGFALADFEKQKFFQSKRKCKFFLACLLLALEGLFIYQNQGNDKSFLFSSIPLSLFLTVNLLVSNRFIEKDFSSLKIYRRYLFFTHPIFLELIKWCTLNFFNFKCQGILLFTFTVASTITATKIVLSLKKLFSKKKPILDSFTKKTFYVNQEFYLLKNQMSNEPKEELDEVQNYADDHKTDY